MVVDEPLHDITGMFVASQPFDILCRVLCHHEISSPTDIYHPAYRSQEHGNGCFVYPRQMACRYQQVGQQEHGNDYESHTI